jgi:hypothetical protein
MGRRMVGDIFNHCKTGAGFAAISDVGSLTLSDMMESFFLAETLKYAYLLFSPAGTLDLKKVVFTTEAHPLRIRGDQK